MLRLELHHAQAKLISPAAHAALSGCILALRLACYIDSSSSRVLTCWCADKLKLRLCGAGVRGLAQR